MDNELFELCKAEGCSRKHEARGYCSMHYKRLMRTGNPLVAHPNKVKHAMSYKREYFTWSSMLQRCTNPNHPKWKDYGGRGIRVCDRWLNFNNFYEDTGDKPDGLEIDRIDNEGNYEPGNVKWSTRSEQMLNTRRSLQRG